MKQIKITYEDNFFIYTVDGRDAGRDYVAKREVFWNKEYFNDNNFNLYDIIYYVIFYNGDIYYGDGQEHKGYIIQNLKSKGYNRKDFAIEFKDTQPPIKDSHSRFWPEQDEE